MIIFYSKTCEGCSGNQALAKMKEHCEKQGVDFQEHRTILWERYEEEANKIMELNPTVKLPFFYSTNSGMVLEGYSMTPLDTLQKIIEEDKNEERSL